MNRHVLAITLLLSLGVAVPAPTQDRSGFPVGRAVTVMSWNVSNGVDAELSAVPPAASLPDLLQKVAAVSARGVKRCGDPKRVNLHRKHEASRTGGFANACRG